MSALPVRFLDELVRLKSGFLAELVEVFEDEVTGGAESFVGLVFFGDALEGREDVFEVVAVDAVQDEICRVELGAKLGALVFVPFVDAFFEASGLGEGNHVFGGAGEL